MQRRIEWVFFTSSIGSDLLLIAEEDANADREDRRVESGSEPCSRKMEVLGNKGQL